MECLGRAYMGRHASQWHFSAWLAVERELHHHGDIKLHHSFYSATHAPYKQLLYC